MKKASVSEILSLSPLKRQFDTSNMAENVTKFKEHL